METTSGGFGGLLRRHRRAAGLTQAELADRAGVSVRSLRDIESGRVRRPQPGSIGRLAAALPLSAADRTALLAATGRAARSSAADRPARSSAADRPARSSAADRPARSSAAGRPGDDSLLRVGVLGPLLVHRGAVEVVVKPPKQRCLLGLLALQPNQVVPRDEIVDVLWGDEPPGTCLDLVHSYVARLRALVGAGAPALVTRTHHGYRLELAPDRSDVLRFADLAARAAAAGADPGAHDLYATALRTWRGPVCAGLPSALRHHPAAVALGQRHLAVATAAADLALRLGRAADVVAPLLALSAHEPLHEGLHARLVLALAASGQQAAALRLFGEVRSRLAGELGIEPGRDLQAAHLRVLRQEDSIPIHRPAHLPAAVPAFVGRDRELRDLDDLLPGDRPAALGVCVISGMAGVGKTSLAVHWAHRVRHRFGDGQLFVNLHGYAATPTVRPIEALASLLYALGVPPEKVPVDVADAAGMYRSLLADRRVLIVLDNADDADQVRPLLPGSPTCAVVVTSRDRLAGLVVRDGARPLPLDVLSPAESADLLDRVAPGRREPATADLARLCGYLPLALRIAAANLTGDPRRGVGAYVAELGRGNRLAALRVDGDEQTAVRATFALSYAALPACAQAMFRRLGSVPCPDFTARTVAVVMETAEPDAAHLLDRLAASHLVERHPGGRYAFHDLVRLYAAERAADTDPDAVRLAATDRLIGHYLRTAGAAATLLYPEKVRLAAPADGTFASAAAARDWLDAERANMVALISHAAEHGPAEPARLLADTLYGYFALRRHLVEWLTVTEIAHASADRAGDLPCLAATEVSLADIHWRQGRYPQALAHYGRALDLGERAGWEEIQSAALAGHGNIHLRAGRPREAAGCYERAVAINHRTGRRTSQANSLNSLGSLYWFLGRIGEADSHYAAALDLFRETGSRPGEAVALRNLGMTGHALGRFGPALDRYSAAVSLHRELGNRNGEADCLHNLAAVHRDTGRYPLAADLAATALALVREAGDQRTEANVRNTVASVYRCLGDHRRAIAGHDRALHLARATDTRYPEAAALVGLALAHEGAGETGPALGYADEAAAIAGAAGCRLIEGQALAAASGIHAGRGDFDEAGTLARRALAIHRETGYRLGEAQALLALARALAGTGADAAAARHRSAARARFDELGAVSGSAGAG